MTVYINGVATVADILALSTYASDSLRNSNDADQNTLSESYVKLKEVLLNADLPACRIKFDLASVDGTNPHYGRIYKNGVPIGTEQSHNTSTYATKSEDFSGFVSGDLIQIYGRRTVGGYCHIKNMRFYYDTKIAEIEAETLTTAVLTTTDPTISMTNQDP